MTEAVETRAETVVAIHLDAVGGIAGDMFVAALLDALPFAWTACQRAVSAMSPPADVQASSVAYTDGVLTGRQFHVSGVEPHQHHHAHDHVHDDDHHHHDDPHQHTGHHPWRDIRKRIENADLSQAERSAAIGIFTRLAIAEAAVHGIAVDDVAFHEVGAWDSIVDIVAAAAIIAGLPNCRWSVGSLPRGRGLVKSAHGMLPVPAPATVELLKGYNLHDDGEDGERITPTGAAILSFLEPSQVADLTPRRLLGTGTGFGTKRLKHRSNILRATLYGAAQTSGVTLQDTIEVLRCEIDDQTAEDLAVALDNIRACDGVLDVCQWPVHAKKGRMATAVQVLVSPDAADRAVSTMLDETTTLGIRRAIVARSIVERSTRTVEGVSVKLATRPASMTAKAEIADIDGIATHAARQTARARAERSVLDDADDDA